MERGYCIYKKEYDYIYMVRAHSNRSGESTLYPVAINKNYRSEKGAKQIKTDNG